MKRRLLLFSSDLERSAAFPEGIPEGLLTDISGVGFVDAGIGTLRAITLHEPDEILYFGTCGAYPGSGLEIGDMIAGGSVRIGSGDTLSQHMRIPGLMPSEVECDPTLTKEITDLEIRNVVCTLGITEHDELATTLSSLGEVENLELFSVVRAAGQLPVAGILGVTNRVGATGGKEWRENFQHILQKLIRNPKARKEPS